MARIFISYKRADKDKVFPLKERIEKSLGIPCWIDIDGIESDAQFMSVIIRAINECEIFLFMYSHRHAEIQDFEQDWTIREINLAQKKGKRIVFVNIDKTPLSDNFEMLFGLKQQVDATDPNAFSRLLSDLRTWLNMKDSEDTQPQKTQPQRSNRPHSVRVYGYKEWYLIKPDVKVYQNGKLIGKLPYSGYMEIESTSEKDILQFQWGLSTCRFILYPSFSGSLQLITNRITSTLSVEVI